MINLSGQLSLTLLLILNHPSKCYPPKFTHVEVKDRLLNKNKSKIIYIVQIRTNMQDMHNLEITFCQVDLNQYKFTVKALKNIQATMLVT